MFGQRAAMLERRDNSRSDSGRIICKNMDSMLVQVFIHSLKVDRIVIAAVFPDIQRRHPG